MYNHLCSTSNLIVKYLHKIQIMNYRESPPRDWHRDRSRDRSRERDRDSIRDRLHRDIPERRINHKVIAALSQIQLKHKDDNTHPLDLYVIFCFAHNFMLRLSEFYKKYDNMQQREGIEEK